MYSLDCIAEVTLTEGVMRRHGRVTTRQSQFAPPSQLGAPISSPVMSSRNPINSSRNSTVSNEDNALPGPSQIRPATENNSVIYISSDDEAILSNTAIEIVTDSEDDITPSSNSHKRVRFLSCSLMSSR